MEQISKFLRQCNVYENTQNNQARIDNIYTSSTSDGALKRHTFLELLVRTADFKFRDRVNERPYYECLELLLKHHILPNASTENWQDFRTDYIWTLEIDDLLRTNLKTL